MATREQIENAAARRAGHVQRIKDHITTVGYPPTLSELAAATDVDRETVKKDMRVLADEGIVEFGSAPAGRAIRLAGYRVALIPETTRA